MGQEQDRAARIAPRRVCDPAKDAECVRRMANGDGAAFEELYDRYASTVFPVMVRIVGGVAEAEEVLQETWLQAWRNAETFDTRRGTVLAWLLNMARSRALDRYRSTASRHRAETQAEAEPIVEEPVDPSAAVQGGERSRRIREALDALKPRQREVLEIAYFEGLSQTEISAKLGVPVGTVKTWMRQGTIALREMLAGEEEML